MVTRIGRTAVVVGASIAGLSAARILSERFEQVIVIDRDGLPTGATPRRGVPQGRHGHVLLTAGQRALDGLFPGLLAGLVESGATLIDPGMDLSYYRFGATLPRLATDLRLVICSRPFLELAIRRRVQDLPTVDVRGDLAVSGLVGDAGRVTGVRLDDGSVIDSELVIDCTGRGSRAKVWLTELACPAPRSTEIKIGVGYTTRLFRRAEGDLAEANAIFVLPAPPDEYRIGLVLPIERDRWLITLGGWHGAFPRNAAEFDQHARSLPHPDIAHLVQHCEPLSEPEVHQFPSSRRRHFEELRHVPAGFLALGDAICSFNPIYGQGITCAVLEAVELGRLLDRHAAVTGELSVDYYRAASGIIATPWQFAAGGDFAYPQTKGVRPRGSTLLNAYARQIQLAAQVDPQIRQVFVAVQHLIMSPAALRKPSMIFKVLRAARKAPGAQQPRRPGS